ncbi:MAG: GLPGLI family protein [Bacteroidales bacterium]|nr:GLPGLI family protein [Bacteroidales bacterium]
MRLVHFVAALLSCWVISAQQDLRISYAFLSKTDTSDSRHKAHMDMKLDISGHEAVFYSEELFLADSLSSIAFSNDGNIKDGEAYLERRKYSSANTDMYYIDYASGNYKSYTRLISNVFVGEKGTLELPGWTLVDSTRVFGGYSCKKAEAEYLGRKWNVWYTEEIPVNSGPWLLWGCPGLIVYASDSENLFNFYILNEEYVPDSRWPVIEKNYSRRAKIQKMPVKDFETIRTRAGRDMDYMRQLMGGISEVVRDRNGKVLQEKRYRNYQPLTGESYWK